METKNERKIPEPSHHVVITSTPSESEISLLEILFALKRQWLVILGIITSVTLLAVILALVMPKIYRAEAVLLPPHESDIEMLNIPNPYSTNEEDMYLYRIKVEDLYMNMIRNLRSNSLRLKFFEQNNLYEKLNEQGREGDDSFKVFQKKFNELLSVKESGDRKKYVEVVLVRLEGAQPDQVASWLNDFVDLADKFTVLSVKDAIRARIKIKISNINEQIVSLRMTAEKERHDELARISEALAVAEKLKIEDSNQLYQEQSGNLPNESEGDNKDTARDNIRPVEYYKGTKALSEEVKILKNRKNDDPFIPELRKLQEELALLQKIVLLQSDVHAVRVDQEAISDPKPVKPKRSLVVVLGFILGLFAAVGAALIRDMLARNVFSNK